MKNFLKRIFGANPRNRDTTQLPSGAVVGTGRTVKIRTLTAPTSDPSTFDPGSYICTLEFYETDDGVTETDRDDLAQFLHILAFLALQAKSSGWAGSSVEMGSSAYHAIESHFGHLEGWASLGDTDSSISYPKLASFLMQHFPPRRQEG